MQVLKFGGSSVKNAENIEKVFNIVSERLHEYQVVVLSALGGVTDSLLQIATLASKGNNKHKELADDLEERHLEMIDPLIDKNKASEIKGIVQKYFVEIREIALGISLLKECTDKTKDRLIAFGEILSTCIFSAKLYSENIAHSWIDARKLIVTDDSFGEAKVNSKQTAENISHTLDFNRNTLYILPGFVAANAEGETTTLGRGGSDYTGALVAAALNADSYEIWTDVSGMMTADPRLVINKKHIEIISYKDAMELSHFGAKIIHPPSIEPVMQKNIAIKLKNTFEPQHPGTIIHNETTSKENRISGISSVGNISLVSLEGAGMRGMSGFSKRLFESLSLVNINVVFITQSSSEFSICVGVDTSVEDKARKVLNEAFDYEMKMQKIDALVVERDLAIVAVVGDGMKNHTGISGKMFSTLGRNGINVRAIAQGSSERNISAVILKSDVKKAINVLHETFFENTYKQINVFITGVGNVGRRLVDQLRQQRTYLQKHSALDVKVIGLSNSKKMIFDEEGIDLENWQTAIKDADNYVLEDIVQLLVKTNLRNTIFVDVTASTEVASLYPELLQKTIGVVACNKIAASSSFQAYQQLKQYSAQYGAPFLFETNVGAGLPVITSLNDLVRSGDTVTKIEAVLSGTLNFVFNNYDGTIPFADIVQQAQDEGFSEPDPRLDLNGKDVMRKILILARESGVAMEMGDITNTSFLPERCLTGTVAEFYQCMREEEQHFRKLYDDAQKEGSKLKFVARFQNGKAEVGLQHIEAGHDFFHLYGKDNIVLFYTNRYTEQPLVVKGAGAGAEVTASGVFGDIIRAAARH